MKKSLSVNMKHILKVFLSGVLLFFTNSISAQFQVDFTMSSTEGCVPLVVVFKNTSKIDTSKVQVTWNFGNGNQSVEKVNTQAAFNTAGVYDIVLTLDSNGVKNSKTYQLSVYDNPQVKFGADIRSGCVPLQVKFTDSTTSNYNKIVSWTWNFGDGTGSNQQHPNNTFTAEALHNITLVATDDKGCKSTLVKENYVITTHQPVIDFTYSDTISCVLPLQVKFNENIQSNYPYTIQWDFGNGLITTNPKPSMTYTQEGIYPVKLTTTNNYGCKNEIQKNITIKREEFQVKIISDVRKGCTPFIYKFDVESNFTIANYQWTLGSNTSTKGKDSISISQPGIHILTLNVKDDKGCTKTVRDTVEVYSKPIVDFTLDKTEACIGPVEVHFTNLSSSDVVKHAWEFSYSTNSSDKDPVKIFTTDGTYNVAYTGTNIHGCSERIRKVSVLKIERPVIEISATVEKGCIPFQSELSLQKTGVGEIKNIQWVYPDGSIIVGNTQPSINVINDGVNVFNVIVDFEGNCPSQTITKTISGGTLDKFSAVVNPDVVCVKQGVIGSINNPSPGTTYTWHMGDRSTIVGNQLAYDYSDVGIFNVSVVAEKSGCKDSVFIKKIEVVYPMASFTVTKLCNSGEYRFTNKSIGHQVSIWDFGDGNQEENPAVSFVYKFENEGLYNVKLYVENKNTGCKDSIIVEVDNRNVNNNIQFTPLFGCVPYAAKFDVASSDYRTFSWKIGDTVLTTRSINYTFKESGKYDVELSATRRDGCIETYIFKDIVTVNQLDAEFEIQPIGGCAPIDVQIKDLSVSKYSKVSQWDWNLGSQPKSSEQNPFVRYEINQNELVQLTVTDEFGCEDTISKEIPIFVPKAEFTSPVTSVCTGVDFKFENLSAGVALQYFWTIGNDEFSFNEEHPSFKFSEERMYDVKLLVIDANNCKDSIEQKSYLKVENFKYDFEGFPRFKTCPELITNFNVYPSNLSYKTAFWDFGNGNQSLDTIKNPVNIYAESGIFDVSLYLEDYRGCKDTIVKKDYIEVKGPRGHLTFSPTDGCLPLSIDFKASFVDSKFNFWDFGNGIGYLDNQLLEEINFVYTEPGMVMPSLILDDGLGCVTQLNFDTIFVYGAKVKIETSDLGICTGGEVEFRDVTIENEYVPIINRTWEFSSGSTSNDKVTIQKLSVDTTSYIQAILTVETGIGCIDKDSVKIKVHHYPQLQLPDELVMCKGDSLLLEPLGAANFEWSPKRYFENTSEKSPKVSPLTDTWFKYIGYDTLICPTNDSVFVKVVESFDAHVGPDTMICRGGEVQLFAELSEINSGQFEYTWSVDGKIISTESHPLVQPEEDIAVLIHLKNGHCKEQTIPVFIGVRPIPEVIAYQDTTIALGQSFTLNAESDQNVEYSWFPNQKISCTNCINPVVNPDEPTEYTVVVKNDVGCTNQARVKVDILDYCSGTYMQAPNVFSPNYDGKNDEFRVVADRDKVKFKSLSIYNRFGEQLFHSEDEFKSWDGNFNNIPVNSGVYIYYYEYECYSGVSEIYKGNITLLR